MIDMEIFEGERIDDLQCSGLYIIQNKNGFCFGIDAVLLSSFAKVKRGEKALDMCTGNGVIHCFCTVRLMENILPVLKYRHLWQKWLKGQLL